MILIMDDAPERIPQTTALTTLPIYSGSETITDPSGLGTPDAYTLYRCEIPLTTTKRRIRIMSYHQSFLSSDANIVIGARVFASGGAIVSAAITDFHASFAIHIGGGLNCSADCLCVAKAQLYNTLQAATPDNATLLPSERMVWNHSITANGGFLAALLEFDIEATAACTLYLRTLVSASASLSGAWNSPVAWPRQQKSGPTGTPIYFMHQRGWWPYSHVVMNAGTLDCKQLADGTLPSREVTVYPSNSGPEMQPASFAHRTSDTYGTSEGGKGCWGATLSYDFTLTNTSSVDNSARVHAICNSNNAYSWFGALKIAIPGGYTGYGSPGNWWYWTPDSRDFNQLQLSEQSHFSAASATESTGAA